MPVDDETSASGDSLAISEASHRIKNDLQLLSSWIAMSARQGLAPERIIQETIGRIQMIARLHDALACSRTGTVSMAAQLSSLVADISNLSGCAGRNVRVIAAGTAVLSGSQARLALVLAHELIVNALRHAFGAGGGTLIVDLNQRQDVNCLTVSDDGIAQGTPPHAGEGSRIVEGIVRALGGTLIVRLSPPSGLHVEVFWPAEKRLPGELGLGGSGAPSSLAPNTMTERQLAA